MTHIYIYIYIEFIDINKHKKYNTSIYTRADGCPCYIKQIVRIMVRIIFRNLK